MSTSSRPTHPTIGIIGGHGEMGGWFARWFGTFDLPVLISDLGTELTNSALVQQADVVLFAVPIDATESVMQALWPDSRPDQLWMDITSIKVEVVKAMLRSKAEVLGTHPMFGGSVDSFNQQTIILCPARVSRWQGWLEGLLEQSQAKVKISEPETHDYMMTVVQGLTHFSSIALAHAFKLLNVDIPESLSYTSPVYRLHLDMMGRIMEQSPELYADIQLQNKHAKTVIETYIQSAAKLFRLVEDQDREAFVHYFKEAAAYLGDFKKTAFEESNALIKALVDITHTKKS